MRLLFAFALLLLASCSRDAEPRRQVVLYSSADDYVLREVAAEFERESGIAVLLVGDTEATKTTGLVTRLLAERGEPRADVWWSSEAFGTIQLARAGVLEPYTCDPAEGVFDAGWPAHLRGESDTWYGFAQRARVFAYSTPRVSPPPTTLAELTDPRWRGRVGMARPQFGTTRGHMAALCRQWGPEAFEAWLTAMRDNGLRLYDGNATAVRKVAEGEIDVCLTDSDDVFVAHREGWPIALAFEAHEPHDRWPSFGPMVMPNTVALVAGAPHRAEAESLIEFLLTGTAERVLRASDSRNYPVHPGVEPHPEAPPPPEPARLDPAGVADEVPAAMEICARVLGGA